MTAIPIGRLLRANTTGCAMGCRLNQGSTPAFGDMIRIPLNDGKRIYGLVHEIHIDDDGLVRQLVSAEVAPEIIEDNRHNRNVPIEMSVVFIGWEDELGRVFHTRVPYPPLTLDEIFRCDDEDILRFTSREQPGYLRALLRNEELPAADLLTAHLTQVLSLSRHPDSDGWRERYLNEVIALMKDEYPQLMDVLTAISYALPQKVS
jgi:hypothetical protein